MAVADPLNQYQTQQPQLTAQASPQPGTPAGLISGAMQGAAPPAPASYTPVTRQVKPEETVRGQVDSILAKDGPLFERARSLATEQFAGRGLVNSSMAIGAAQGAVMDRALDIAAPDAAAYERAAGQNTDATNRASEFKASAENQFGLQRGAQDFEAGEAVKQREFAAAENQQQRDFQGSQAGLDREQQARLQALQEAGVNNRFDQELAMRSSQFNVEQAATDRRMAQQHANTLEQMGFQNNFAKAQVPSSFAASVSASTMDRVNAILGDPNLEPAAKENAVRNVIDYANSTLAWAESFYGTPMQRISSPQGSATARSPAAAPAPAQADQKKSLPEITRRMFSTSPEAVVGS